MELTKSQIKLIDEAAELAAEIKTATDRLELIKKELQTLLEGNYKAKYSILSVTLRKNYDGPTPAILMEKLKEMKMKNRFMDCVKVMATETKKVVGEEVFTALQTLKSTTPVFSFKKVD